MDQRCRKRQEIRRSGGRVIGPLLSVGDLIMARRQLLNLAELAELSAAN
jgi:hypothetical protein